MFGYVPPVARMQMSMLRPQAAGNSAPLERLLARAKGPAAPAATPMGRHPRRGLIIDLDDTLYPRERFVRSGLAAVAQHVSRQYGIPAEEAYGVMTRALAGGRSGSEMQALCDRFGLPADVIPRLVEVFRNHTPALFLAREVVDALRALRADGWGLAILTNGLPSVQFRKVAALGLTLLVDEVIYAEEHAPEGKPSAAPFRAALRSLDLTAAQCVCVGDDLERDIRGAKALGMATIRFARHGVGAADNEADMVIHSMRQLPDAARLIMTKVVANVA